MNATNPLRPSKNEVVRFSGPITPGAIIWAGWAWLLLPIYYRQLWRLPTLGWRAWLQDNHSLAAFAGQVRHLIITPSIPPLALEAVLHMVTAVAGFIPVLLAGLIIGSWLTRYLFTAGTDWRDRLLFQIALGWGGFSYLLLGLAAVGLFTPVVVRGVTAAILLTGLVQARTLVKPHLGPRLLTRIRNYKRPSPYAWFLTLPLSISFIGALAPEVEYDALWYHLWLPHLWLEAGRPVDSVAEYISLYPITWELLYGAGMVWGNTASAKLVHFTCLPLTILLVFRLSQRCWPEANPWLAAALFAVTPTILWQATTTYVDLALTLYLGLAVFALLVYAETQKWGWLIAAGLSLALALAIKHLALFMWGIAVGGLWIWYGYTTGNWRRATIISTIFAIACLLLPLPWYSRNYVLAGNPFFPDLYSFFGASPPERWNAITEQGLSHFKNGFGRPRTLFNLLTLPWDMTVHAARYRGSLGLLFLLLLPGLALKKPRHPWRERVLLGLILIYLILWATPFSSFQMRFLMPLTPFLAVLAALAAFRLSRTLPVTWGKRGLSLLLAGLMFLNLPPFLSLHERDRDENEGWLTHVIMVLPIEVVTGYQSPDEYLASHVDSYRAWQYINNNLPQNVLILTFSGGDHLYSHRPRLSHDATLAHSATWGALRGQETEAFSNLRQLGVTHLLLDKRQLASHDELRQLAIIQSKLIVNYKLIYEDQQFILYEIPWNPDKP